MITYNYLRFHYLYLYLYPVLMLNAWSLHLQIIHVLRFHHSPGGLVGNSGCSSVHLSASVSLSLLPATSRVYFSFLFSSPRLSFSLEHSHHLSSLSHSFILIISSHQGHLSAIIEPILLPLFISTALFLIGTFSSSHIRDIFLQFTIIIPIILIGDTCTSPPLFISRALLLIGTFSSSHFSFSFLHSHHLMTSQGHLSAIMEPILLPLFSISSHLRGIFRLSCNYFSRPLIREQERVWRKWRAREKMIFWVILNPFLHNSTIWYHWSVHLGSDECSTSRKAEMLRKSVGSGSFVAASFNIFVFVPFC